MLNFVRRGTRTLRLVSNYERQSECARREKRTIEAHTHDAHMISLVQSSVKQGDQEHKTGDSDAGDLAS